MKECSVFIRIGSKRPPDLLREVANIRKSINFFIRARVCHWRTGPLETGIPGLIQTSRPDQKYPLHEEMSLSLHRIFRFPHRQRQACSKTAGCATTSWRIEDRASRRRSAGLASCFLLGRHVSSRSIRARNDAPRFPNRLPQTTFAVNGGNEKTNAFSNRLDH